MKHPVLIVDGYNIIGAWEDLSRLKARDLGSAREQLIATLSAYSPWSWERIIVVFDGRSFAWEHMDGVEVVFTEGRESADTMIERLAGGLVLRYQVEVATSDFAEYKAASNLGAAVFSAQALKERLKEKREQYRGKLAKRSGHRGIMLNDVLHKSVVERLEKLRRL